MNVISLSLKQLIVKNDESVNLGDLLCYKDIAIGLIVKIDINSIEIKLFSDIFNIKIGHNEGYFYQKKNNYLFYEYFNSILTANGSLNSLDWQDQFEFTSILDEGCVVSSGDIIGYLKHNELKYPILVPDGIVDGLLIAANPKYVNYAEVVNTIKFKDINYPIYIYQNNYFNLIKTPNTDNKSLVIQDKDIDNDFIKLLSNFEIIIHISSQLSENYIKNSIVSIKEYFNKAGVNNVQSIGLNDYPYFANEYLDIITERSENIIKQLLLRSFNIIVFYEGLEIGNLNNLKELEGEYRTKSGKSGSMRLVKLK
jgi:hypothetical protein